MNRGGARRRVLSASQVEKEDRKRLARGGVQSRYWGAKFYYTYIVKLMYCQYCITPA